MDGRQRQGSECKVYKSSAPILSQSQNFEYTSFDYRKVPDNGFVRGLDCSAMNGY